MDSLWDAERLRADGHLVADWLAEFYRDLETRPITPDISPAAADALFDEPLPRHGLGFEATLAEVASRVASNALLIPHPRYFGLMNPTPVPPAIFAEVVVSALNQNMGAWSHSPTGTAVEKRVIRWLCDLVGYPDGAFGTFCSGGSVANLIALRTAIADRLPETVEQGLQAMRAPATLYFSAEAHFSVRKAAITLGLGSRWLRAVPVDARARIRTEALRRMIEEDRAAGREPFALVGVAGTTSSGSVDPLPELADIAEREGLWYHVDAAWGGAALLSARHRERLAGIERADSITFDPHKWFFMPIAAGAVLVRDRERMFRTFASESVYIPESDRTTDLRHYGVVGSKRMDALKLWTSLKALGGEWYESTIDRHMELAADLARRIAHSDRWELVVEPDLNILCFRLRPPGTANEELPALQDRVVDHVVRGGSSWISATAVDGDRCIRWMSLSPALTADDLDVFWNDLNTAADALLRRA